MNINIRNGNVIDELKKIPDESVDCVVSSPPYYGLRDYSAVATYSASSVDEVIETANIDLQSHRGRVLEHQKYRYYLTDPLFDDKKKRWYVSLKYDVSEIWGGNPECIHEWSEYSKKLHNGRGDAQSSALYSEQNDVPDAEISHNLCRNCGAWRGQLGLEPTYQMYGEHLMLVMKELKRVLKKTGTLFWNMGDSYASSGGSSRHFGYSDPKWAKARNGSFEEPTAFDQGIEPKSLMMIPERFAMALIDDGWILRNKIVWYKRNAMPSSTSDRLSNKWEYVFFFTKSKRYHFDLDSIRKPLEESSIERISQENVPNQFKEGKSADFAETEPVNNIPKIMNNMHQKYDYTEPREDDSKYPKEEHGQKSGVGHYLSIQKRRNQSYIDAKILYPDDPQKQKEYIKAVHDNLNKYGVNPGDVITPEKKPYAVADRDEEYVEYRNLPPLQELSDFLNKHRKNLGYTIDQIESKMGSQSPHHWFNAESYPNVDDWKKIKGILELPDTYDKAMTEVFLKPSEKQNNIIGANPGDVDVDESAYDIFTDPDMQDAFIEFLERERPELLRSVFLDIPTMSHSFAHFAVFPERLVRPFIEAGCPSEVCIKCGRPKLQFFTYTGKFYDHATGEYVESHDRKKKRKIMDATGASDLSVFNTEVIKEKVSKWLPSCKCNAGFGPGTVLDPFAGSGTVGVVAKEQGKNAILIEVSPEYLEIIKNRLEIKGSGTEINAGFVDVASVESMEEDE